MIEVKDRIPTYPGRIKLIPVPGQANTYDMVRADEPIEPGTPINRALFQMFIDEVNAIRQQINDEMFELSQRTNAGNLADGTVFGLYENGVLVPFIKACSDYPEKGRILAVRQSCITSGTLMNSNESSYENCRTDLWLNNEYFAMLDTLTRNVISDADIGMYTDDGFAYIPRKVFLLTAPEHNVYGVPDVPSLGQDITYFSTSARKIATLNGTPVNHWTRSLDSSGRNAVYFTETGEYSIGATRTFVAGIRPAFTLPADFEVTIAIPNTENVMATAEVI